MQQTCGRTLRWNLHSSTFPLSFVHTQWIAFRLGFVGMIVSGLMSFFAKLEALATYVSTVPLSLDLKLVWFRILHEQTHPVQSPGFSPGQKVCHLYSNLQLDFIAWRRNGCSHKGPELRMKLNLVSMVSCLGICLYALNSDSYLSLFWSLHVQETSWEALNRISRAERSHIVWIYMLNLYNGYPYFRCFTLSLHFVLLWNRYI